ncbi:amidohydrolase family protein [Streptomonospora sp. PA3]|uniref:amidohydrolase family protein n=1 Tax=Streptomonospora sp. PA3 TaxID=2607326 RepID=UPI0012DBD0C9|nr:amidohydrolase family protein [Streptomonospora sp. PA3]MUL41022.1 amidohydrolase family protein [Streptomonospora sp. PA3]
MPRTDTVIRSRRAVLPAGTAPACVRVSAGRIVSVGDYAAPSTAPHEVDLGDTALLPGGVDVDAAVQAPGQPLREGYVRTASAAVRAGVTTLVASGPADPPITGEAGLRAHLAASADAPARIAFLGAITAASTPCDLVELRAAGVVGFACSLSDGAGADLPGIDDTRLRKAMTELAAMDVPLVAHAEDAGELSAPEGPGLSALLAARPARAERRGVERLVAAARMVGTRVLVSPFTAAECAAVLAAARAMGVGVSAQTCPHYLCLPIEQVPDDSGAHACLPPLRSGANRNALWSALLDSRDPVITQVGSGHRPGTGAAAVSWTLPALWTAARRRGRDLADLARWTAREPADLLGMACRGRIAPDCDADLVAFDPDAEQTVPAADPGPYAGRRLVGRVRGTWVEGEGVFGCAVPPARPQRASVRAHGAHPQPHSEPEETGAPPR